MNALAQHLSLDSVFTINDSLSILRSFILKSIPQHVTMKSICNFRHKYKLQSTELLIRSNPSLLKTIVVRPNKLKNKQIIFSLYQDQGDVCSDRNMNGTKKSHLPAFFVSYPQ